MYMYSDFVGYAKLSIDKNSLKATVLDIDGAEVDYILILINKEPIV